MDRNNEQYSDSKYIVPSNNKSDIQTNERKRTGENEIDPSGKISNNKDENEEPDDSTFNRLQDKHVTTFRTYRKLYIVKRILQEVPSKIIYQKRYVLMQPQCQTQKQNSYHCGDQYITAFPTRLEVVPLQERSQSKWYGIVVKCRPLGPT